MKALTFAIAAVFAVLSTAQVNAAGNDQAFVTQVGQGGLAEIDMGKTAGMQGSSDAVKKFGQQMVTDHTKAGDALKVAAADDGLTVPAEPSANQKADAEKMKSLQGAAFDKAYASAMVKDHQDTIALFEKEASSGQSAKVKAFAEKTLPTLKGHLKMAQGLNSAVK